MTATDGRLSIVEVRRLNRGDPVDRHHHAVALVDAGAVEVVEKTARHVLVEVVSRSEHGIRRRVTSEGGRWSCDCPAFHHGHGCAHVAAADLVTAPAGMRRLRPVDATAAPEEALPWS